MLGAEVLRVAAEFDDMKAKGMGDTEARERLRAVSTLSPKALQSLKFVRPGSEGTVLRTIPVPALAVGMVLQDDVATDSGVLIAVRGGVNLLPYCLSQQLSSPGRDL